MVMIFMGVPLHQWSSSDSADRPFIADCGCGARYTTAPPPRLAVQVDGHTQKALRRMHWHVTEEWLWKLGPAKLSVFRRPCMDELDSFQFVRDLKSRYQSCRAAAGAPAAGQGPELTLVPFVTAVNQVS